MNSRDMPDRRLVLAGGAAILTGAATTLPEDTSPPLFTSGALVNNQLAEFFKVAPAGLAWPDVKLVMPDRKLIKLDQFRGKTLIVSLWAEWCLPCLVEMPGMAILQKRMRSDRFELVSILTNTEYNVPSDADDILKRIGIRDMVVHLDGSPRKDKLITTLGKAPGSKSAGLPCNLIIDAQGRLRGRSIGGEQVTASDGKDYSIWATNSGLQFCEGLSGGALEALT